MEWADYIKLSSPGKGLWVIDSLMPHGGTVIVSGAPKVGKSLAVLEMMAAVADPNIKDWNGYEINQHGPILYLQMDMPRFSFKDNHMKFVVEKGYAPQHFCLIDRLFTIPLPFDLKNSIATINYARAECERLKEASGQWPIYVVFDSFRDMYVGEEDSSGEIMQVINNMRQACQPAGIIIIHHPIKAGAGLRIKDEFDPIQVIRGSGHMGATADQVVYFVEDGFVFKGRLSPRTAVPAFKHPKTNLWQVGQFSNNPETNTINEIIKANKGQEISAYQVAKLAAEQLGLDFKDNSTRDRLRKQAQRQLGTELGTLGTGQSDPLVTA